MQRKPSFPLRRQRGITLLTSMIFLLIFLLVVATSMKGTLSNAQAIHNMQWRAETVAASDEVTGRILSDPSAQWYNDTSGFTAAINGAPLEVDMNGDGINDIQVTMPAYALAGKTQKGPRCLRHRTVPTAALDPANTADAACMGSSSAANSGLGTAVAGSTASTAISGDSPYCADSEWVLPMHSQDKVTRASVDVVQGVAVRGEAAAVQDGC